MNNYRKLKQSDQGFTLIEILVVILIMAVLAAIVIFAVQNLGGQTAKTSCKADYKTIENAVGAYSAQVGHFPRVGDHAATFPGGNPILGGLTGSMNGIEALFASQTGQVSGSNVGPWLKDVPSNGSHYSIVVSTDGKGAISVDDAAGNGQSDCRAVQ